MKIILSLILLFSLTVQLHAQRPTSTNYDESKVPEYTLPAVLTTSTGKKVRSTKSWEKARRPEILNLFAENIYGQMPLKYDRITYSIINEDKNSMSGKAQPAKRKYRSQPGSTKRVLAGRGINRRRLCYCSLSGE
jgi:hypothetical protein